MVHAKPEASRQAGQETSTPFDHAVKIHTLVNVAKSSLFMSMMGWSFVHTANVHV